MTNIRLHYMDNLRAIVMLLGVFFHAALAYSPFVHRVWISADQVNSRYVDYAINFLHIFRMPLFFVVAGFFAALLIERRGMGAMLKNRTMRVLLPFMVFWPLVTLGIKLPARWALENVQNLSPYLQLLAQTKYLPDAPQRPLTTLHLWFLYYLVFFYLLTWLFRLLIPHTLKDKILAWHPLAAIILLPLLLVPGLGLGVVPYPAPDSFIPEIWAFAFFGLFYAYGYSIYSSSRLIDYFQQSWPLLVLASVLLFVRFQSLLPEQADFVNPPRDWWTRSQLILCLAGIAVWMSVAGLACAKNLLNGRSMLMRYISDASYWIYIVHLPLVFIIQYWLVDQPGSVLYKYSVSVCGTLAICLVSYFLLVRWTPIGWLLNGRGKDIR